MTDLSLQFSDKWARQPTGAAAMTWNVVRRRTGSSFYKTVMAANGHGKESHRLLP
jgi:hypothetical protein